MKTESRLKEARAEVVSRLSLKGLSKEQEWLLAGMSVALCWMDDAGGDTLERLLQKEFMDVGKDEAKAGFSLTRQLDKHRGASQ